MLMSTNANFFEPVFSGSSIALCTRTQKRIRKVYDNKYICYPNLSFFSAARPKTARLSGVNLPLTTKVAPTPSQSCNNYFPFWERGKRGKNCLRDESIVYNSLYTIYNSSTALFVEKVH